MCPFRYIELTHLFWVPITATRVVYRVVVPHASCGMDSNQPTHLRVGKTTNAHTHLFFPPEPSHTRVCGAKLIKPTRPYVRPRTLLVPHATRDAHRAPAIVMVQTLVHVRLTAVAMSLNFGCHVGQLQLPWLLNCSCHLRSSDRCHFGQLQLLPCMVWFTIVAMI